MIARTPGAGTRPRLGGHYSTAWGPREIAALTAASISLKVRSSETRVSEYQNGVSRLVGWAIRLAASSEQGARQAYLRTPDLGGWSGPRQQSGGNRESPGSPERVRSDQRSESIANFVTVRCAKGCLRSPPPLIGVVPIGAGSPHRPAGPPRIGHLARSGASGVEPPAENVGRSNLYRDQLSVRWRSMPDLGADSSRSVHRHPRAYHLWVFPAAHLGRDEFVGQGLASLLRPRPSDDHGSPFRYEVPELPAAAQRAWHRLGSTYCVAFGEGVGGDRMLYGERNARIGVVLRTRQGQVAVDG